MNFLTTNTPGVEKKDQPNESPKPELVSVLFVCQCNVCRSPAAQAVLQRYVNKRFRPNSFLIESKGVSVEDVFTKPSISMRWTAFRRGYRLVAHGRSVMRSDLDRFDLVIAMDSTVLAALRSIHSHPKSPTKLLTEFLTSECPIDVPDPMYRSLETCNTVFDMLESACPEIVKGLLGKERGRNGRSQ